MGTIHQLKIFENFRNCRQYCIQQNIENFENRTIDLHLYLPEPPEHNRTQKSVGQGKHVGFQTSETVFLTVWYGNLLFNETDMICYTHLFKKCHPKQSSNEISCKDRKHNTNHFYRFYFTISIQTLSKAMLFTKSAWWVQCHHHSNRSI